MKILIIGGIPESLTRFRGRLIERLCAMGHEVVAVAGHEDPKVTSALQDMGVKFEQYHLQRNSMNPLADVLTCIDLYRRFKRQRPDLVLSYTVKPVVWGGIAARLAGVPRFHAMVTGLGNQFTVGSARSRLLNLLLERLYRLALRNAESVIFQNQQDRAALLARQIVTPAQAKMVNGSGVDINFYQQEPLPAQPTTFLCIARLLAAKGLREYMEAARRIRQTYPDVVFRLAGYEEPGADAVSLEEVQTWHRDGIIDFVGQVDDSRQIIAKCHVFVLPSYYGEGLPRTILEAMSMGRPVLTTDNVGCRDAVRDGVTGLLVAPLNVDALVEGMQWFLQNPDRWEMMAAQGRKFTEERFDVDKVNDALVEIMALDPVGKGQPCHCPQETVEY